jgi:hypothetical protein
MSTQPSIAPQDDPSKLTFTIPIDGFRSLPIPGIAGGKLGNCFVRVTDLPDTLDRFMSVNPRVPNRNEKGILTGPVIQGIKETLSANPDAMAIKNQGIYLLVEEVTTYKATGGQEFLTITLSDESLHGIVNGGHTYAAIRDEIENASTIDLVPQAYVRLHLMSGIPAEMVPEIAEGLNRSKQVDDPSLENLKRHFDKIRDVMQGRPGDDDIAYHQGDDGEIYITEILVLMEMFNRERFNEKKHPNSLYNNPKNGLKYYIQDLESTPSAIDLLVPRLPEILALSDTIRKCTPDAARHIGFEFGRMKNGNVRTGAPRNNNIRLPFINQKMKHRVPNGWLYPMLAAFRANVQWDLPLQKFEWKVPLDQLLPQVIDDLIGVCITAHVKDNVTPDKIGKRESIYEQCYDKVQLNLYRINP